MRAEHGRPSIILASRSKARQRMLEAAGLALTVVGSDVDEASIRETLEEGGGMEPDDVAEVLARAKAEDVSRRHPASVVIGADQVLAMDSRILTKSKSIEDLRRTLIELRGRTHELHSAVCLAKGGEVFWAHVDTAHLTMRRFSMAFLGDYLARAAPAVLSAVGGYEIEGIGVQLFEKIEGDYFTILGLPLIPLLNCLREHGVLPE